MEVEAPGKGFRCGGTKNMPADSTDSQGPENTSGDPPKFVILIHLGSVKI